MNGAMTAADFPRMVEEIAIERRRRERDYPDLVAKGRLTQEEATWRISILFAIGEDLDRGQRLEGHRPSGFTWNAKLRALDQELDDRRRFWPERVAKGRLEQSEADSRIALLQAIRDLFWADMLAWDPPAGAIVAWSPANPGYDSDGGRLYRQAVREHMALVHAGAAATPDFFAQA